MTSLEYYITQINKTWKKDTPSNELQHCVWAINEEPGEIAGWYKKHYGYIRPKDEEWKKEIMLEMGDLLYYLVKFAELNDLLNLLEKGFDVNAPESEESDFKMWLDLSKACRDVTTEPYGSTLIGANLLIAISKLKGLMTREGFTIEAVMQSNIAKLAVRHGSKFSQDSTFEKNRNRKKEAKG